MTISILLWAFSDLLSSPRTPREIPHGVWYSYAVAIFGVFYFILLFYFSIYFFPIYFMLSISYSELFLWVLHSLEVVPPSLVKMGFFASTVRLGNSYFYGDVSLHFSSLLQLEGTARLRILAQKLNCIL